jgi:hypothetical protein
MSAGSTTAIGAVVLRLPVMVSTVGGLDVCVCAAVSATAATPRTEIRRERLIVFSS